MLMMFAGVRDHVLGRLQLMLNDVCQLVGSCYRSLQLMLNDACRCAGSWCWKAPADAHDALACGVMLRQTPADAHDASRCAGSWCWQAPADAHDALACGIMRGWFELMLIMLAGLRGHGAAGSS